MIFLCLEKFLFNYIAKGFFLINSILFFIDLHTAGSLHSMVTWDWEVTGKLGETNF